MTSISFLPSISFTASGSQPFISEQVENAYLRIVDRDQEFQKVKERIDSFQSYEEDWDDNDGVPASDTVACLAAAIVRYGAISCLEAGVHWKRPSVALLNDGSISLFWESSACRAYLIVGPGDDDVRVILQLNDDMPVDFELDRSEVLDFISHVGPSIMPSRNH